MPDNNPEPRPPAALNPQSLRLEDVARIITAYGLRPTRIEMLQADIDDGAPVNCDRTMNLLHFVA